MNPPARAAWPRTLNTLTAQRTVRRAPQLPKEDVRSAENGTVLLCYRRWAMLSPDTDIATATFQEEAYKRLGEAGRLRVALELSDLTHSFAIAGVKERSPGMSDSQARQMLASILYNISR